MSSEEHDHFHVMEVSEASIACYPGGASFAELEEISLLVEHCAQHPLTPEWGREHGEWRHEEGEDHVYECQIPGFVEKWPFLIDESDWPLTPDLEAIVYITCAKGAARSRLGFYGLAKLTKDENPEFEPWSSIAAKLNGLKHRSSSCAP